MEVTYFTCTLGQAVDHQSSKSYQTINDLIQNKARSHPDTPVVGFYEVEDGAWTPHVLTFGDIKRGTARVAATLKERLLAKNGGTVALLCPSSPHFLFAWLALIWLGHPALLIAPQCSPSAIAQLCKLCNVRSLIYDDIYDKLATQATKGAGEEEDHALTKILLPFAGQTIFEAIKSTSLNSVEPTIVSEADIAYLHHTSGTSSGTPKPIPQSHKAAIGVLPILNGQRCATFTTTPLYHGGVADLFRAWTSNALIWLFPGKGMPITSANICRGLDVAAESAKDSHGTEVKYFSSVPYVLQMMAADREGLGHLQRMEIVGVGGAALPAEVGDGLVETNVNLISRFGSAECGFLMSSHRDYENDKEWQYLRSSSGGRSLLFEPRDHALSELVIQNGWPHMAKRNREDGSYATADLFAPHPTIAHAWRYHSRADSQLTLITGKKFDPAPLEDAIRASCSATLEDVIIFGDGKPYPGALLFRAAQAANLSDDDLLTRLSSVVERMNRESQSHARIPRSMLTLMPRLETNLEKSSKGTVLRRKAYERFAEEIESAYEHALPNRSSPVKVPDANISEAIRDIVIKVAGDSKSSEDKVGELADETDLFSYGLDSVACIQIRHALTRLVPNATTLPLTVVQDTGTISDLAAFLLRMRSGSDVHSLDDNHRDEKPQHDLMLNLAKKYSVFSDGHEIPEQSSRIASSNTGQSHTGTCVLLTGPTGSLGAHILSQLLSESSISKIHLLVRGTTPTACRERVLKALSSRRLPIPIDFDTKVQIYNFKLSNARLGLSTEDYKSLTQTIDVIVHLAWSVNFLIPLRSFVSTHLEGLRNLINFALSSPKRSFPPRLIFCSSVAAVSNHGSISKSPTVPESVLLSPSTSGSTGYARSKWVAEQLCAAAHERTRLKNRISIARVGQLSGATDSGVWAASEAYPLMLSSGKITRCLPDLDTARRNQGLADGEVLGWLPVDIAARAFVEEILGKSNPTATAELDLRTTTTTTTEEEAATGIPTHHVLNPSTTTTWSTLLSTLSHHESFETVPLQVWLSRLQSLQESPHPAERNHPALKLLGFWRDAYGSPAAKVVSHPKAGEGEPVYRRNHQGNSNDSEGRYAKEGEDDTTTDTEKCREALLSYEMTQTHRKMPSLRNLEGVMNEIYILKLWIWIKENM